MSAGGGTIQGRCHCGRIGFRFKAATAEIEGKTYATLNANCFVLDEPLTLEAPVGAYESESLEQRMARRAARWTPVLGSV